MSFTDRQLGMNKKITRRDFLDGAALATAGAASTMVCGQPAFGQTKDPAGSNELPKNPPQLQGMRGHHPGSFETMHALRDSTFLEKAGQPHDLKEHYDLIILGGGISGLAAAHLYRQQAGNNAKVLIIENHDDFGGHAKRNEFTSHSGKFLLGYGGSQTLQTPSYFSPAVESLLKDIGVETSRFEKYYDSEWYDKRGLKEAVFFTKEAFGSDKLVIKSDKAAEWVPQAPLSEAAKQQLIAFLDAPKDYFSGLSRQQKFERMSQTSYLKFLTDDVKLDPSLIPYFQQSTADYLGCGIDAVTCADAWGLGNPGFDTMDLGKDPYKTMSPSSRLVGTDPDKYIHHFPDGNASVARLLVRKLIPEAIPGSTMEDIVLAKCDYSKLDNPSSKVRIRLLSTGARVRHNGPVDTAREVEVLYARADKLYKVTANHVILACFNQAIPYIAPEVADTQATALRDQQKIPLIYTNVQIRNWQAFAKLGVSAFDAPGHYWDKVGMDFPVSMGGYNFADKPEDPVVLHLSKVPDQSGGGSLRDQALAGRYWVASQSLDDLEGAARDLLARALGAGGFDPARDIEAITVNRWSHGYAYEYMRPWDAYWPDGQLPITTARKGWGRIAIANSDAGAYAYANSAIDQATRAVRELLGSPADAPAFATFPGPPLDKMNIVK